MSPTVEDVVSALKAADIEAVPVQGQFARPAWRAVFQSEFGTQVSILLLSATGDYFIVFSPIAPADLETMPAEALRDFIRLSSTVKLAKLEYVEGDGDPGFWFATSECSVETYTGEKLRRRMEACAVLAEKIRPVIERQLAKTPAQ